MYQPYKGLNPYEESDKDNFFGRTSDIRILSDKIRARKLTLLFAASGVGKSSLLQAGVMPELKNPTRKHYKPLDVIYYWKWSVSNPLETFVEEEIKEFKKQGKLSPNYKWDNSRSLQAFLQFCTLFSSDPLVVILDQFEEFFYYQRFNTKQRENFIGELSKAICDEDTATAFVISMREDSALEMNAFKGSIPFLFENFYRLEKLTEAQAREAIVKPVERLGFAYESELLAQLLRDLGQREWRDRYGDDDKKPFPKDAPLLIETPYLQVICQRLWALDGTRVDKQITLKTYVDEGRTEGILKKYFDETIGEFSPKEKKLASLAFTLLVSRYGTKLARPLSELVDSTLPPLVALMNRYKAHWPLYQEIKNYVDQVKVGHGKDLDDGLKEEGVLRKKGVLQKLDEKRILRRHGRHKLIKKKDDDKETEYWYELYHDILAKHVCNWTEEYERRQFIEKSSWTLAGVVGGCALLVALLAGVVDYHQNKTQVHLRLSPKSGVSDTIEVYQGQLGSWDFFGQQGYRYETDYRRQDIEADKLFNQQAVVETRKLIEELVGRFPLSYRIGEYGKNGQFDKNTLCLANTEIFPIGLSNFRILASIEWLTNHHETLAFGQFVGELQLPFAKAIELLRDKNSVLREIAITELTNAGSDKAVPQFIALLKDENSEIRKRAAEALGSIGNSDAIQPLIALLKDENSEIRKRAAEALGKIGNNDTVQPLIALLKDENSGVRSSAAKALGDIGNSDAVQPLITLLKDDDQQIRWSAAEALGSIGNSDAVQPLIALLKDENSGVRRSAAKALGKLGELGNVEAMQPLITFLKNEFQKGNMVSYEILRRQNTSDNKYVAGGLFFVAGFINFFYSGSDARELLESGITRPLVALLKDEDSKVRNTATIFLGQSRNANAIQPLITLLSDEDPEIRSVAALLLGYSGNAETIIQPLMTSLRDKDSKVRSSVALALGRLGNAKAIQPLIALLEDENSEVRDSATLSLGALGSIESFQPLTTLLKKSNEDIYGTIPKILRNLSGTAPKKGNGDAYGNIAEILRNLGSAEAVQLGILTEEEQELKEISLDSLVKSLIEGENIHKQREAIKELGKILAADRLPPPAPPRLGGEKEMVASSKLGGEKEMVASSKLGGEKETIALSKSGKEKDAFGHPSTLKPLESLAPPYQGGVGVVATPTTTASALQTGVEAVAPQKLTVAEKADIQTKLAEIVQNPQTIFGVRADALRAIAQLHTEEVAQFIIKALQQAKKESDTNLNQKYFVLNALQALGINGHKSALSLLEKELDNLTEQKQQWREQRDTETVPTATTELTCDDNQKPPEITDDKGYWQKDSWEIVLGQAIARLDPENAGLELLRHSLTNVRQGARFGLAQVATAQLVEKLNQQREDSKSDPDDLDEVMFVHSAYRALDEMLIALEKIGTEQDFKELRRIYPHLQDDSVKQRVEWTIGQLEYQYSD